MTQKLTLLVKTNENGCQQNVRGHALGESS